MRRFKLNPTTVKSSRTLEFDLVHYVPGLVHREPSMKIIRTYAIRTVYLEIEYARLFRQDPACIG